MGFPLTTEVKNARKRRNDGLRWRKTETERYEPLQNEEVFSFFDSTIDQKTATFETAGVLGVGERVWALAKMPGVIQVIRGDDCNKYLLLSNTHSGQGSVTVKFTAIRFKLISTSNNKNDIANHTPNHF